MDLLLIFTLATIFALAAVAWGVADTLARHDQEEKDSNNGNR